MNKILLSFTVLAALVIIKAHGAPHERVKRQNIGGLLIPREFQNLNIENYLKNPNAVKFQLRCVIYDGPCDRIGKYLKTNFPVWLQTQCKNCSPQQKQQAIKAISHFQKNYPKEWADGVKKYRGSFSDEDVKRFEEELGLKVEIEVPTGKTPKPDTAGLVDIAREAIAAAKTTPEPLILETRSTAARALVEASSTTAKAPAASVDEKEDETTVMP